MFKKDKKTDKGEFNLREIGAALKDPEDTVANPSGNTVENVPEEIGERGKLSRSHTRESSRDRVSNNGTAFHDLVYDIRQDPDFAGAFDGLGRIILGNIAQLKELSKKANVPYVDTLDDTILDYNDYKADLDQAIESRINTHVDKTIGDIDTILNQKLLDRELAYHDQTETIIPPKAFAENEVLRNDAAKITAANNAFPTKRKFSGSNNPGQPTIVEFLTNMNLAQRKCNLSEKEFIEYLNLCCTGPVFEDVACMIDCGKTLPEVYQSLLLQFDKRLKPKEAKKALDKYMPPMGATLSSVSSDIMKYGQRAALSYKKEAQSAAYDNLCIQALLDSLPDSAQLLAETCLQELNSRMAKSPTFAELSRALTKYSSTIDREFKRLRPFRKDNPVNSYRPNSYPKPRNIRSAHVYQLNNDSRQRNEVKDYRNKRGNYGRESSESSIDRYSNTDNQRKIYQAQQYKNNDKYRNNDRQRNNDRYKNNDRHRNNDRQRSIEQYRNNTKTRNNDPRRNNERNLRYNSSDSNTRPHNNQRNGLSGRPHCALCGKDTHKPIDGCFEMRDDSGNVVPCYPSQSPCGICKRQGITLYHPQENCFNRPIIQRFKEQGLLQWPTREERDRLKQFHTGQFTNPQ